MTLPDGPGPLPVPSVALVVLDGWGLAEPGPGNAVELAETPVFDELWARYAHTTLTAWGRAVGLPEGQMGNSEVGHLNLGAGAVVRQDLTRIDDAIADGTFAANDVLRAATEAGRQAGRLHLLGLVSEGGVHASMDHLRALIEMAEVPDLVLHAFTDGRDTLPDSGAGYLATVERWLREHGGRVGTVSGRYYAMDRDKRWDRIELALDAMAKGKAEVSAASGEAAVRAAYERGETDEFIKPTAVGDEARIRDGDAVIFFNFRPDRARQMTQRIDEALDVHLATLTEYQEDWTHPVAFPPARPEVTIASVLAERGTAQLHVAETEKYAHVTYFFNGGSDEASDGETRILIPSPKVATYDLKPEMSVVELADRVVAEIASRQFDAIIINFANPDMVGHTGVIPAAVTAVETVDRCLGEVVAVVHETGGACLITADHGNCDHMLEPDGGPNTAHSMNPVPLIVTADVGGLREGGVLADVVPTILELLAVEQPEAMTGRSLIERPAGV